MWYASRTLNRYVCIDLQEGTRCVRKCERITKQRSLGAIYSIHPYCLTPYIVLKTLVDRILSQSRTLPSLNRFLPGFLFDSLKAFIMTAGEC